MQSRGFQTDQQSEERTRGYPATNNFEGVRGPESQDRGTKMDTSGFAAEGSLPLGEIPLLGGKVFLAREGVQEKERNEEVRPNVWTKLKGRQRTQGPYKYDLDRERKHRTEERGADLFSPRQTRK